MNNYFIDRVASSFTNVDDQIAKQRNSQKKKKQKENEKLLGSKQERWRELTAGIFHRGAH